MTVAMTFNERALAAERAEREHQELLARRRAFRKSQVDLRTRLGRRQRSLEVALRQELTRQGRTITVDTDGMIGHLAVLLVQREVMTGMQSRGEDVDLVSLTRIINSAGRLRRQLGLRPSAIVPPKPPKPAPPLSSLVGVNRS
jgi:hypothetical protein